MFVCKDTEPVCSKQNKKNISRKRQTQAVVDEFLCDLIFEYLLVGNQRICVDLIKI